MSSRYARILWITLFSFIVDAGLPAQVPAFSIHVMLDWVGIDTIVSDSHGKPVIDLRHEDFRVFEDGVERPLKAFSFEKVQPADQETANRLHGMCATMKDPNGFYFLAFLSLQSKPDGKLHTVRVECRRTGVRLCYRKSYFADDKPALTR